MGLIPGVLTYIAYNTEVSECFLRWDPSVKDSANNQQGKYELRGKRKGDTIAEY